MGDQARESPQSRLLVAGFSRRLEWWVTPDGAQVLGVDDAIAGLDSGEVMPKTVPFPDTGVRALPDELVDRMFEPASPPAQRRDSATGWVWLRPPPKEQPAPADKSVPTERELRRRSRQLELEAALGWESLPEPPQPKTKAGFDYDALRQQFADEMLALLTLSDEQAAAK